MIHREKDEPLKSLLMQEALKARGLYHGALDNWWGKESEDAYQIFLNSFEDDSDVVIGTIAGVKIYKTPVGFIHFTAGLMIDADGSPHAYHPKGSPPGLDYLANAGKPGNWWGIATDDNGKPYVQTAADPAPGFYVSTTALERQRFPKSNPHRYIDSESVPYFVLPSKFPVKVKLGIKGIALNTQNGKSVKVTYADIGPVGKIGEGSMALADALGIPSNPKKGGTEKKIIRYEFPA